MAHSFPSFFDNSAMILQAFVLKYLLFFSNDLNMVSPSSSGNVGLRRLADKESAGANIFSSLSEEKKSRWIFCGSCSHVGIIY